MEEGNLKFKIKCNKNFRFSSNLLILEKLNVHFMKNVWPIQKYF